MLTKANHRDLHALGAAEGKMLTKANHRDLHALIQERTKTTRCCSADLPPESPRDAVYGPIRRSSRTHESVRLIAQDLGTAHVLSFHCLRTQGPSPDLAQ